MLMVDKRGLKNRKTISNAIRTELADALKQLSEATKIPMSKLLDEALDDLINKYANSTKK
jgi:predicted DNA-binding protein